MNDSPEKSKKPASADPKAAKQQRLAQALRANLARRKAQARARASEAPAAAPRDEN
jgi:hypothetical protein